MKTYQDDDPLHGNGKAIPKPKQPTKTTIRPIRIRCRILRDPQHRGPCCILGCKTSLPKRRL